MSIALVYFKRSYWKANKVSHKTLQREKTGRHRKKCCELKVKNGKKSIGEVFFHIISSMILLLHLFCLWRLWLAIHIPPLCLEIAVHEVKGEGKEKKKRQNGVRKTWRGARRKRSIECKGVQRRDENVFPKVMVFNGAACIFRLLKTSVAGVQEEPNSTCYSKCKISKRRSHHIKSFLVLR